MSQNDFIVAPTLLEPFPDVQDVWTCPITGLRVPKKLKENLAWRTKLLAEAEDNISLQQALMTACAKSILFFMNAFCFTYRVQVIDEITHQPRPARSTEVDVPFITWACQDRAILEIEDGVVTGHDIGVEKSRDMGASWITLTICVHKFLFRKNSQILFLSRTEKYVDEQGNHKSLFWKVDYIHRWLPEWMCPPGVQLGQKNRRKMHVHNKLNDSTIDGESTTENAAAGDRRLVILMDEFALVKNGTAMKKVTRDATPCRIVNSTPRAGSEYSKWITGGQIKVVRLAWWDHPEKGLERSVIQNPVTQKWHITSPWYRAEELVRTAREIAEEIDMDHFGAGDLFFGSMTLELHRSLFVEPCKRQLKITLDDTIPDTKVINVIRAKKLEAIHIADNNKSGELKIWVELINGRLDQSKHYSFGIDISKGQGASNSVVSIRCLETKEKVGEWVSAQIPPYLFARYVIALAIWVGGANPKRLPFLAWESQGPGWDFGKLIVMVYRYPFYYCDKQEGVEISKTTKKYGWHSTTAKKEALLQQYSRLLAHGGFINHSEQAINEAATYITYEDGGLGPAMFMEESVNAKKTHGDRVIADALSVLGDETYVIRGSRHKRHEAGLPLEEIPANSIAGRRIADRVLKLHKQKQMGKIIHPYNLGI